MSCKDIHLFIINDQNELLLFKNKIKRIMKTTQQGQIKYKELRCRELDNDGCIYFTVVRIIMRDLLGIGMSYYYEDLSWESEVFIQILGHINDNIIDIIKKENRIVFFIKYDKILQDLCNLLDERKEIKFINYEEIKQLDRQGEIEESSYKIIEKEYNNWMNIDKKEYNKYIIMDLDDKESFKNHYGALYSSLLREEGENWRVFKVWEDQYPNEEVLKQIKGIVMSGSFYNVTDMEQKVISMIQRVTDIIQIIMEQHKHIRILGICFGHQLISHILGGKVDFIKDVSVKSGYIRHMDLMRLNIKDKTQFEQLFQLDENLMSQVEKQGLRIAKSHEQEVIKKSENQIHIADSLTTLNEILVVPNFCLSMQGHPEMSSSYFVYKLLSQVNHTHSNLNPIKTHSLQKQYLLNPTQSHIFATLINNFIKQTQHPTNDNYFSSIITTNINKRTNSANKNHIHINKNQPQSNRYTRANKMVQSQFFQQRKQQLIQSQQYEFQQIIKISQNFQKRKFSDDQLDSTNQNI